MSLMKSEIKASTTFDIGERIDEKLEAARGMVHYATGGAAGLRQGSKLLEGLFEHVKKDIEAGLLDKTEGEPLKVAEHVNRYIKRCMGVLENLATAADINVVRNQGKVEALEVVVKELKRNYDDETQRAAAQRASEGSADVLPIRGRADGVHPGMSLADRRKAEEAGENAPPEPAVKLPPTSKKKKR